MLSIFANNFLLFHIDTINLKYRHFIFQIDDIDDTKNGEQSVYILLYIWHIIILIVIEFILHVNLYKA